MNDSTSTPPTIADPNGLRIRIAALVDDLQQCRSVGCLLGCPGGPGQHDPSCPISPEQRKRPVPPPKCDRWFACRAMTLDELARLGSCPCSGAVEATADLQDGAA